MNVRKPVTFRMLDENHKLVEGLIGPYDTMGNEPSDDMDDGIDFDEPEDIDSLPPLTDAEIREAEDRIASIFTEAKKLDMSQPLTLDHELLLARALVDTAGASMEAPEIAKTLPQVRFVQMNPCPAISLDRALELLKTLVEPATLQFVRDKFSPAMPQARPTHSAPSGKPS